MWTSEQGVLFSGLNEAFEVTTPSLAAISLLCDLPVSFLRCLSAQHTVALMHWEDETSS